MTLAPIEQMDSRLRGNDRKASYLIMATAIKP